MNFTRSESFSYLRSKLKLVIFALAITAFLYSCITYKSIEFQALRPAQIKIGTGVERIDIHCEYCNNERAIYLLDSSDQTEAKVALKFLESLNENLQKSPIFQTTRFTTITSDSLLSLLKNHKARNNEPGLIILLDSIFLSDTVINAIDRRSMARFYTYGVIHKFGCRTYVRSNMQILENYLMEDTLFWPPQPDIWSLEANLPLTGEAYKETGLRGGEAYARYLAPYWTDLSRLYYYGPKPFNKAYNFLQRNQLDSALHVLNEYLKEKPGKSRKMMNLHNMAVIHELKDDMENAYLLADSAQKVKKSLVTKDYPGQLRIRKLDKIALDWQLK